MDVIAMVPLTSVEPEAVEALLDRAGGRIRRSDPWFTGCIRRVRIDTGQRLGQLHANGDDGVAAILPPAPASRSVSGWSLSIVITCLLASAAEWVGHGQVRIRPA